MDEKLYRQGDVFIRRVDAIPEGLDTIARDNGRVVLAYGEVTGHAHVIVSDDVTMFGNLENEMDRRFLAVEADMAHVTHEEHSTIDIPRGYYEVIRQNEYTPEAIVRVAD